VDSNLAPEHNTEIGNSPAPLKAARVNPAREPKTLPSRTQISRPENLGCDAARTALSGTSQRSTPLLLNLLRSLQHSTLTHGHQVHGRVLAARKCIM